MSQQMSNVTLCACGEVYKKKAYLGVVVHNSNNSIQETEIVVRLSLTKTTE